MYQEFDSPKEVQAAFKRCRKVQDFIASDAYVAKYDPKCSHCGKRIADDDALPGYRGNRGMFNPKTKKIVLLHYECSWDETFTALSDLMNKSLGVMV